MWHAPGERRLRRWAIALVAALATLSSTCEADSRVDRIRARGYLTCGIVARVRGFTDIGANGEVSGFEPDLCRAVAAAILGVSGRVEYITAQNIDDFLMTGEPDLVARRLTVTLRRAVASGRTFSSVVFFDGTALLVRDRRQYFLADRLTGRQICVAKGSEAKVGLLDYFAARHLTVYPAIATDLPGATQSFLRGECDALAGDLSELAGVRASYPNPEQFTILPEPLSQEPLALLMHADDPQMAAIVQWTLNALVAAEELHVTSMNVASDHSTDSLEIKRLLGIDPGNGRALGLDEQWAAHSIATVGNYGEIFARNLGADSALKLPRGMNALRRDGGLMYALPMR